MVMNMPDTPATTTTAPLDVRAMTEAPIDRAAERRNIDIGMCLAAALLLRDFDNPTHAREILHAAGIDAERVRQLELDDYDADPLIAELSDA